MKNRIIIIVLLIIMFSGCEKNVNSYDKKTDFPENGGKSSELSSILEAINDNISNEKLEHTNIYIEESVSSSYSNYSYSHIFYDVELVSNAYLESFEKISEIYDTYCIDGVLYYVTTSYRPSDDNTVINILFINNKSEKKLIGFWMNGEIEINVSILRCMLEDFEVI